MVGYFHCHIKMADFQNQGLMSLPHPTFSALHFSHGLIQDTENKALLHRTHDCSVFMNRTVLKRMQEAGWLVSTEKWCGWVASL